MRRAIVLSAGFVMSLSLVLAVEVAAAQQAQPGQPPQKGIQGIPAQPVPGLPGYYGYTQTPWYGSAVVQKQLSLTPEQVNQLNKVYGENWQQYTKSMAGLGTLSEQERAQKMLELSGAFNSQVTKSAQDVLKPEQFQRYQQLNWQHQGLNAFNDPAVQAKLNLNADQMTKVEAVRLRQNQALSEILNKYGTDPTTAVSQFQLLRKQTQDQLNQILNDQQRQAWGQLTGEPIDFTPEAYRPPTK